MPCENSPPTTRSATKQIRQKYQIRAPIEKIPQRQVIQKRPTTTATKEDKFEPIERSLDMSGMDVSDFPDVVIMKANQMSRFSKQQQDSFKKRNPKCKDFGGWGKGRYMHPKFRKGEFLEVDNIQVFQLTNAISNSKVGGMLIHKPFAPKRLFATSNLVSSQRNFDREDTSSQDTNVGHKLIKAVRKDHAGAKATPPKPSEYKGFLIPNKHIPLTYANLDFRFNDDNFVFFGAEGSTIDDDIFNFASFYEMVDNETIRFVDDDIVADYRDLVVNYSNNGLSDCLTVTNTFRFWGDARRFRKSHPIKSSIHVISGLDNTANSTSTSSSLSNSSCLDHKVQNVLFDADNMDDDSSVGSGETLVGTVISFPTAKTTKPVTETSVSSDDDAPFFPNSSIVEAVPVHVVGAQVSPGLLELTIPVDSSNSNIASEDELPKSTCSTDDGFDLAVNTSFTTPVAIPKKAPPASRNFKLTKPAKRKRDESILVTEHEEVVDHILQDRAAVGRENAKLRDLVKQLKISVKELTVSDRRQNFVK